MNRLQQKQAHKPIRPQIYRKKRFLDDKLTWASNAEEKNKNKTKTHAISVQLATWERKTCQFRHNQHYNKNISILHGKSVWWRALRVRVRVCVKHDSKARQLAKQQQKNGT